MTNNSFFKGFTGVTILSFLAFGIYFMSKPDINFKLDGIILEVKSHMNKTKGQSSEIAKQIVKEPNEKMTALMDSIESINNTNMMLMDSIDIHKKQINLLKDSLVVSAKEKKVAVDLDRPTAETIMQIVLDLKKKVDIIAATKDSLIEENQSKDREIFTLHAQITAKNLIIDSLNMVMIEKNNMITELRSNILDLQDFVKELQEQLPNTITSFSKINEHLKNANQVLQEATFFNRKKKISAAEMQIRLAILEYEKLNKLYRTDYFDKDKKTLINIERSLRA